MKNLIIPFILSIAISTSAQTKSSNNSTPPQSASPKAVGMSEERLDRIDLMCQDAVDQGEVPGIVALVARNGKIVFHNAYGMADASRSRKMKKDDIFRIASQSKAITSTAVMMLWEEAKFNLNDPISRYIPEFKNPQVLRTFKYEDTSYTTISANKEITIRHLLTHTSGIGYSDIDGDERMKMIHKKAGIITAFETENVTIEECVKKIAKLPLHHQPGEKYTYSLGLDVLGYFIEIMSGMPFDEFLRKKLFDPLGMDDTWFYLPKSKEGRLVSVQSKSNGKWQKHEGDFYDVDYPVKGAKTYFSGGGGLSSTAEDYAKFLQMYLNEGELNGIRILSRTTIKTIMGNQTGELFGGPSKYHGLAFGVVTKDGESVGGIGSEGTFDWGGYFNTQYFADPEEQTIGILMKQTRGKTNDQTGWKFRLLVGQAIDD